MVAEPVDVAVIGAGPAGLACATRAAQAGLSVVLLDEQETVGGQIYRAIEHSDAQRREILGPDYVAGAAERVMCQTLPSGKSRASTRCTT
jgi:flavin-dependent dehydrogenase